MRGNMILGTLDYDEATVLSGNCNFFGFEAIEYEKKWRSYGR